MKKNPFAVLGLAPDALSGLSKKQIRVLIKHMARGLQSIHHPDLGGNVDIMVSVNLAMQDLENEVDFDRWKKAYIKVTAKNEQIKDLELQLKTARDLLLDKSNVVWEYLQCFYQLTSKRRVIFNCQDVFLRDVIFCLSHPKGSSVTNVLYGELFYLDSNAGVPTKRYLTTDRVTKKPLQGESKVFKNKLLIGSIDGNVIKDIDHLNELLFEKKKTPLLLRGRRSKEKSFFPNRFPLELFKKLMVHMSPSIKMHSFVFAINLDDSSVSLEGQVIPVSDKFL